MKTKRTTKVKLTMSADAAEAIRSALQKMNHSAGFTKVTLSDDESDAMRELAKALNK